MKPTTFLKAHSLPYLITILLSGFAPLLLSASSPDISDYSICWREEVTAIVPGNDRWQDVEIKYVSSEPDSLPKDTLPRWLAHGGIGGGICFKGSIWGFNYTMISSSNWGGSCRFYWNIFKSQNVPSDYYDDGARTFAPKDYLNTLSFNLLKAFPAQNPNLRFSIEAGPALVIYRQAEFELNPSYTPDYPMPGSIYLYYKSHPRKFTVGGTLMLKYEILPSKSGGLEFGIFSNINSYHTVTGLVMSIILGRSKR
ncbi:hypothetical protein EG832_04595 [bacterium]|nr:hypothetical protein [bacterium]